MSNLKVKLNTAALAATLKEFAMEVQQDVKTAVAVLAQQTKERVLSESQNKLSSPTFLKFKDSVGLEEAAPGIHIVSVDEKALWIEEGIEANADMKEGLLKNATKTSKAGYKYTSIPFDHGKSSAKASGYETNLRKRVEFALKKSGIPFKKIEKNPDGSPKTGLLHKMSLGGEIPGKGNTPVLDRVSVYQTLTKSGNIRRDILTFRTVSGDPKYADKWHHPGYAARKFLDDAQEWAEREWEQTIIPEILAKWSK